MRVITGQLRGKRLEALPGEEVTRPTSQRVKEAMFNAIQFEIAGRRVCDAFAGTGQLGIEAMSRGAEQCLFLENHGGAMKQLQSNLQNCGLTGETVQCLSVDALQYLKRTQETFGLLFLDPPYGTGLLQESLFAAAERLEPGGLLVCEAPSTESIPEEFEHVLLRKEYRHGKIKICVFAANEEAL